MVTSRTTRDKMLTPDEIINMVSQQEVATSLLRERFWDEQNLYDIRPYQRPKDAISQKAYTTNRPRQNADRLIAILSDARMVVRSPHEDRTTEEKERGRKAEKFFKAMLMEADRTTRRSVSPKLMSQFAFLRRHARLGCRPPPDGS